MLPRVLALTAALALAAAEARGQGQQGGWAFEVQYMPGSGGVVSPAFPEATVRLLAWFDPPRFFSGGDGDVAADDGSWTDVRLLEIGNPPMPPPIGTSPGAVQGNAVRGFILGQNVVCGFPGCPSPPQFTPLWEGTWRAGDFTPRDVGVITENTARFAYFDVHTGRAFPLAAIPGSGQVRVVPSPGTLALAAALAAARRRRTTTESSR